VYLFGLEFWLVLYVHPVSTWGNLIRGKWEWNRNKITVQY
jgi:hypothetical protein